METDHMCILLAPVHTHRNNCMTCGVCDHTPLPKYPESGVNYTNHQFPSMTAILPFPQTLPLVSPPDQCPHHSDYD